MSVNLDLPKYKCDNCDYFSPMTTKRGKDIIIGCACKKLCDSLEKLEKEKKEIEESPYISKWKYILDDVDGPQSIFMPVTLPKKKFYHDGCPATTDLRITTIKFYDEEYKFCPDCGEPMIVPKYAEDVKS